MKRIVPILTVILCAAPAWPAAKHRVVFNRFRMPEIALYVADGEGKNERALAGHREIEYSPMVSADGKWVVFTSEVGGQADIYRVHPDGSGAEQLTSDPAFDDQGALSPDGKTLAFVSTRGNGSANVWLLDIAAKKYRNLTNDSAGDYRPSWSPDGQWIAFSSARDAKPGIYPGQWEMLQSTGIYIVHPDGGGLRRLTKQGGVAGSPAWSTDGKKILYYETDETGAYLAKSSNSRTELVSVDVATGERRQYTASNETKLSPQWLPGGRIGFVARSHGDQNEGLKVWNPDRRITMIAKGAVRNPSWSVDGKLVVYERVLQPARTEHLMPTASHDPEFELLLTEPFPSYSPDGKQLIYSQYGNNGQSAGDTSLEVMNADGSGKRRLYYEKGVSSYDAVWSPVGGEIVFCVGRYFRAPGIPAAQIALLREDGSGFRVIADDGVNNGFPSWSPDGKQIVYRHGKKLAVMTVATGKIADVTDGAHYDNFPQWSPKGDRIMFSSDRGGETFDLYTMRPDGSDVRRLTNVQGHNAHSIWSNDGEWIVFSSGRKGFKDEMAFYDGTPQPYGEIFAMRADGSDVRQLTDNKWEDASPGWAPELSRTEARNSVHNSSSRQPQ